LILVYLFISRKILGINFHLFWDNWRINTIGRILSRITAFLVILFPIIRAYTTGFPSGELMEVAIQCFPFTGGVFIHFVFEYGLGSMLGFILAIKPSLLPKVKRILGVENKRK